MEHALSIAYISSSSWQPVISLIFWIVFLAPLGIETLDPVVPPPLLIPKKGENYERLGKGKGKEEGICRERERERVLNWYFSEKEEKSLKITPLYIDSVVE